MATQDELGIPFAIDRQQQNFRLLELPPDLLNLMTSEDPPSLSLKSSIGSTTVPANAVLCTKTNTYQIRQVHSSNSVFVLQPSEIESNSPRQECNPVAGLSVIAQCTTMLELLPAAPSATALLEKRLSAYDGPSTRSPSEEAVKPLSTLEKQNKSAVFKDAPLSRQEFEDAWDKLCAFEMDATSWIPTSAVLCRTWRSITTAVTLKGLKLEDGIRINDMIGLVEEDGIPAGLLHAVLHRLHSERLVPMDGWVTVGQDKCVPWVGAVLLNSETHPPEGIATSSFVQQWKNLLPEAWRRATDLELLKGLYSNASQDRILSCENKAQLGAKEIEEPVNTNGRRPGKWHEKFKNSRR